MFWKKGVPFMHHLNSFVMIFFVSNLIAEELYFDRSPYLQSLTSHSVLIASQSEQPCIAKIQYGRQSEIWEYTLLEDSTGHNHIFYLENLDLNSSYFYQVTHTDEKIWPKASFQTLPIQGQELSISVFGDSGWRGEGQDAVAQVLRDAHSPLILHLGDLAYPVGHPYTYQYNFFEVYSDILSSASVYPVLGNHDCFISDEYWKDAFYLPANNPEQDESYYSFDAGDVHFAALNTCSESISQNQKGWLEKDLSLTSQIWKIVYFHNPPYSNGGHGDTVNLQTFLVPLLERYTVDLVLSGHDHSYERFYPLSQGRIRDGFQDPEYVNPAGIIYVVSGGGGGGLYDENKNSASYLSPVFKSVYHAVILHISPTELVAEALGAQNATIDTFSIRKIPAKKPKLSFIRGDANSSGDVGISDAIAILQFLFLGGIEICSEAADSNGSSDVSISDAVSLLYFLFLGGSRPPIPFPECGTLESANETGCLHSCNL